VSTTDLTVVGAPSLEDQMNFARAVVERPEGGAQSILPESYRGNRANVLLAVGLGASMGLSPAESLYRISVIKGKPSASAELIAANVRKAGHRLRVRGDETTCTATIVRADDPEFEFTVTRDLEWARGMGLASNDNYKRQPGTMLQWRAITAVARLACPEALYGVQYTPDELDDRPARPATVRVTAVDVTPQPPAGASAPEHAEAADTADADTVEDVAQHSAPLPPQGITQPQLRKIAAAMRDLFITERGHALSYVADVVGREVESRNELTKDEAHAVIEALEADLQGAEVAL
jgi:hypothetical protein